MFPYLCVVGTLPSDRSSVVGRLLEHLVAADLHCFFYFIFVSFHLTRSATTSHPVLKFPSVCIMLIFVCLHPFLCFWSLFVMHNFVFICCDVFIFDVRSNQSLSTVYTMEILFNIKRVEIVLCPLYFLFLGALLLNFIICWYSFLMGYF